MGTMVHLLNALILILVGIGLCWSVEANNQAKDKSFMPHEYFYQSILKVCCSL